MLDDVSDRHALATERVRGVDGVATDENRVNGHTKRAGNPRRKSQHLQAQAIRRSVDMLDEGDDGAHRTPISRSIATTRGAASGPVPRISACPSASWGKTNRISSGPPGTFEGVTRSISFFFARIRPGTEG